MNVEKTIKTMIYDKFKIEATDALELAEIFQDSFAKIELLFEIEEALKVKISEEDIMDISTVADLISKVKKYA